MKRSSARRSNLLVELLEARWLLSSAVKPVISHKHVFAPSTDLRFAPASDHTHAYTQYQILNTNDDAASPLVSGTASPQGATPAQIRKAYGVDNIFFGAVTGDGTGQTIAIVDAFNDRSLVSSGASNFSKSDLHRFDVQFGLADPPSFTKVNQTGGSSYPFNNTSWSGEMALDVEWTHVIAPKAKIILVEATDNSDANLYAAVNWARAQTGVTAVSMSWGGDESSADLANNSTFTTPSGHPGVSFFSSTGDTGAPGGYPADSPNVVAVGGTALFFADSSGTWSSETVWNDTGIAPSNPGATGGGISAFESKPAYQNLVTTPSSSFRTIPDVAMDADPYHGGVSVCDSSANGINSSNPWWIYGGTSLASPMWAGLGAIVDQGRALHGLPSLDSSTQLLPRLYSLAASDFHDITSGNNALAGNPTSFSATAGYDAVTGRGTPIANLLVPDLAGGTIGGTVFNDTNGNGTLNSGETGISGVTVYIDSNQNGSFDNGEPTTITDASGAYSFADQLGGINYIVREVVPPTYTATSPNSIALTLSFNQASTLNFGLTQTPTSFSGSSFTLRLDGTGTLEQIFTSATASGSPAYTFPFGSVNSIPFTGSSSDDTFNVDLTNGNPIPNGGVTFDGLGGNNTFVVTGSPAADTVSVGNTAVTVGSSSVAGYTNVANIALSLGAGADIVNYNGPVAAGFALTSSGGATLNVNSGTLAFNADVSLSTPSLSLTVLSGASVQFNSLQHLASLNLTDGSATIAAGGTNTFRTSALSITGAGRLDLNDNSIILDYVGASPLSDIRNDIIAGRGPGGLGNATWNGPSGIISTVAHNLGNGTDMAIGYAENSALPLGSYTAFAGQTVGSSAILIRYTRGADANLDGVVDNSDATIIGTQFNAPGSGQWYLGDFDYSGQADNSDVTVLGVLFNPTAPPLAPAFSNSRIVS